MYVEGALPGEHQDLRVPGTYKQGTQVAYRSIKSSLFTGVMSNPMQLAQLLYAIEKS